MNVLLGLLGALCAAGLIRELLTPLPLPPLPTPRAAAPAAVSVSAARRPRGGGVGRRVQESLQPEPVRGADRPVIASGPKPLLHGVMMDGLKSRAYLEDPPVRRAFGYAVGDAVNGGRVQSISEDRVVIARPDGLVEVLLQDPAKPKLAVPAAAPPRRPRRPPGRCRRASRRREYRPLAGRPSQRAMIGRAPTASWLLLVLVTAGCASATPGGVRVSESPRPKVEVTVEPTPQPSEPLRGRRRAASRSRRAPPSSARRRQQPHPPSRLPRRPR